MYVVLVIDVIVISGGSSLGHGEGGGCPPTVFPGFSNRNRIRSL